MSSASGSAGRDYEEFSRKLQAFRGELTTSQRGILNKLVAGAIAAERHDKSDRKRAEGTEAFSRALTGFGAALQPEEREQFMAMLAAGALAWLVAGDSAPDDDPDAVFFGHAFEVGIHLARTAAVILSLTVAAIEESDDDDVPLFEDLPDFPE